jgi:membrane protein YdbS with pleckstrin-like domain
MLGDRVRLHGAQLHDGVVAAALDAASAHDDPVPVQRQVGRVEEADQPDLGIQRIHAERDHGGTVVLLGHRQLQLDAVGARRERDELLDLDVCERERGTHRLTIAARGVRRHHPRGVRRGHPLAHSMAGVDLHPGEQVVFEGHPSWRALLSFYIGGVAAAVAIAVVVGLLTSVAIGLLTAAALVAAVLGFGLLKRTATTYLVSTQRLYIRRGVLNRHVQQTRIDRVQNVNTEQSLRERLLRVGTVDFDTAGTDDSEFRFVGIAEPGGVVNAVDKAQREAGGDPRA